MSGELKIVFFVYLVGFTCYSIKVIIIPQDTKLTKQNKIYSIPIVFKTLFGIFLNLRCILQSFLGRRKITLASIYKPTNDDITTNNKFTSNMNAFTHGKNAPNKKKEEKLENKPHAPCRFPNTALSGTSV